MAARQDEVIDARSGLLEQRLETRATGRRRDGIARAGDDERRLSRKSGCGRSSMTAAAIFAPLE